METIETLKKFVKEGIKVKGIIRGDSFHRKNTSTEVEGLLHISFSEFFSEPGFFITEEGVSYQVWRETIKICELIGQDWDFRIYEHKEGNQPILLINTFNTVFVIAPRIEEEVKKEDKK
jgi:hypothetical protein